jgi:hypothetical protein
VSTASHLMGHLFGSILGMMLAIYGAVALLTFRAGVLYAPTGLWFSIVGLMIGASQTLAAALIS